VRLALLEPCIPSAQCQRCVRTCWRIGCVRSFSSLLLALVQAAALLGQLAAARGVTLASVQAVARTAQL
jgi:hypothetical protein